MNKAETISYQAGRESRDSKRDLISCPETCPIKRAFWLAGWHDRDMESGKVRYHT